MKLSIGTLTAVAAVSLAFLAAPALADQVAYHADLTAAQETPPPLIVRQIGTAAAAASHTGILLEIMHLPLPGLNPRLTCRNPQPACPWQRERRACASRPNG